jgi:hypothetical protein
MRKGGAVFEQIQMTKRLVFVIAMTTALFGGATVLANDSIAQMQRTIDAADKRIAEIVRKLSTPGLPSDVIASLNREKQDQEWVRGQAQLAIFKEREAQRKRRDQERRFQVEVDQFAAAIKAYQATERQLRIEYGNHNADAQRQQTAVERFNSMSRSRQTQSEANRLNTWGNEVDRRRKRLIDRADDLEAERLRLINWMSRLDRLFAQR